MWFLLLFWRIKTTLQDNVPLPLSETPRVYFLVGGGGRWQPLEIKLPPAPYSFYGPSLIQGQWPPETPTSATTRMIDSACLTENWCVMMPEGVRVQQRTMCEYNVSTVYPTAFRWEDGNLFVMTVIVQEITLWRENIQSARYIPTFLRNLHSSWWESISHIPW